MKTQRMALRRLGYKLIILTIIVAMVSGQFFQIALAMEDDPPEEYRGKSIASVGSEGSAVIQEESFGIAWGDPDGPHSVYSWPFTFVQMGHAIQSYQNYSSGTSAAYFHHGIDMIAPNGTQVYTRSGGQVVNVENYQPGQAIYWEVAILDAEGYVWQYHHIDEPTIPDLIYQKFAEWQADPVNGGYIPPNTHIGNIVYWPVTSFGYRFNHIHLNILAAGDVYLNAMEFHTPIEDTQAPEIQAIGLLNGNTIVSGNTASGNYGMYVRARDLYKSTVYYLPPYKTEFSVDGGDWVTVWEFHDFPGGFDDQVYVNDFFVPVVTKGDYNYRDFYIDLGFTTGGQRAFTSEPGEHTIAVRVWDYAGNSDTESFTYNVVSSIPDNGCSSGNGVTRTFQVTEELLVTDVNLGINLTHTTRGQVRVTLKSPTDTTATTIINTSTDSYDNYDMWVDDSSSNPVNDNSNDTVAAPYFDRTAGPSTNGSLDSFNGKSALGTWIVFICDNTSGTTGTVNLIDLEVIGVVGGNEAPIADDQSVSTSEDTALGVTLTGSDPDGDQITFIVIDQPMYGTLSGEAPDLTYTPGSNYYGTDSFTFKVNDGELDSEPATVSLIIDQVNDAPVAAPQSVLTEEDTAKSFALAFSDIEGDELSFIVLTEPMYGTLSGEAPDLTYTPNSNYYGSDNFTFKVSDGELESEPATVSLIIDPVNDAPVAEPQQLVTSKGTPLPITLTGSDIEGSSLTFTVQTGPLNGVLTGSGASLVYTPNAGYVGEDSFTFTVNDGSLESAPATVDISVTMTNEPPIADGQSVSTSEDTALGVTLTGSDPDGDSITFIVIDQPVYGTLSGEAPDLTYTPNSNYYGSDNFTFKVSDGELESEPATVSLIIDPVNDAPVAEPQQLVTSKGTPLPITLTGSDIEGSSLTFTVQTGPLNGVLTGSGASLVYTPNAGYVGEDSFTFTVNDGSLESAPATVDISVTMTNEPPIADGQSVSTSEDTALGVTLTGSDPDGDSITFIVIDQPVYGTLSGEAPDLTYTPNSNYYGSDSFTFKVNDGIVDSNTATVDITVTPVNDAPVAAPQTVLTEEDTAKSFALAFSDIEGDPLTFTVLTDPMYGTLSGEAPDLTYTPNSNYYGSDSFTFKVSDGELDSEPATVSLIIDPVNDAPVAAPQTVLTEEDTAKSFALAFSDIEGDELSFIVLTEPMYGTLSGEAPDLTYTPEANFNGSDGFTFIVNDGSVDSEPATVSITVNAMNDMPYANDQSVSVDEDSSVDILLDYGDVDGDEVTYSLFVEPLHGTLSGEAPELTYTPDANYNGADSFEYYVSDPNPEAASAFATVNITVNAMNDMPSANDQSVSVDEDSSVDILLDYGDVDGDEVTYSLFVEPLHGTLSGEAPELTYTPDANYNGADSFEYYVSDPNPEAASAFATVNITVNAMNDMPYANDQSVSVDEDSSVDILLDYGDVDGDEVTYSLFVEPLHGTLSGEAPELTYTPDANYNGADSFEYYVSDPNPEAASAFATVNIMVNPAENTAPTADSQEVSVDEDIALDILLTGSDEDEDELSYSIVSGPTNGALSGDAPELTYTPEANFNGSDGFTFIVNDGSVDSEPATVSITVNAMNDMPYANDQSVSVDEDSSVDILLDYGDVDGDEVTYSLFVEPLHGTLSGEAPELTYTPDANYNGADSFEYYVSDPNPEAASAFATVNITVNAMNDMPYANDQSVSVDEDSSVDILLDYGDVDGDEVTYSLFVEPLHGTLSGEAPELTYTPDANYNGADSFEYYVSDPNPEAASAFATVNITVNAMNDMPYANDQSVSVDEDSSVDILLDYGDVDGDEVTYSLFVEPLHGTLSGEAPELTYTPDANYNGADSFEYYVSDPNPEAASAFATVNIMVNPAENTAPTADSQEVSVDEDIALDILLTGSDEDEDELSYSIVSGPTNGALSGDAPELTYTPEANFNGSDGFTFIVNDGSVDSEPATVSITVNAMNDMPYANDQSVSVDEDSSVDILLDYGDVDGDEVTYSLFVEPLHGTLSGEAPELTYTPDANYNGADSFEYYVSDPNPEAASAFATVNITVNAMNDMPYANDQSVSVDEDSSVDILLDYGDVDGDEVTYSLFVEPLHGTLSGEAPELTYTPNPGYSGSDSFQFQVKDAQLFSEPATVSISVNPTGPMTVFWDDFETDQGWIINPSRTDTAYLGTWERANPQSVYYNGYKQLGTTVSGSYDLVTGPLAGWSAGDYDLDGGVTTVRSPNITLPSGREITLTLSYYFAHANNSSSADYLRVRIVGATTSTLFQEVGARNDDDARWQTLSVSLNNYAGQTVYLLIEAADASTASLVEAAIDDVLIVAE